jgi:hypothetical protein
VAAIRTLVGRKLNVDAARFSKLLLTAIGVPGLVVGVMTGLSGISAFVADRPLILAPVPRTVAEAAGNRDVADVVVMSATTDMNRAEPARIPLRLHSPAMLTPLEAAVVSERAYIITLVRDRGARLDSAMLRRLRCIARARKDRGTIAYLAQLDSSPLSCEDVAIPY